MKRKGNDVNVPQGGEASRATLELQTSYTGCTQVGAIPRAVGTAARAQRPVFSKVGTNPWSLDEIPPAVGLHSTVLDVGDKISASALMELRA